MRKKLPALIQKFKNIHYVPPRPLSSYCRACFEAQKEMKSRKWVGAAMLSDLAFHARTFSLSELGSFVLFWFGFLVENL